MRLPLSLSLHTTIRAYRLTTKTTATSRMSCFHCAAASRALSTSSNHSASPGNNLSSTPYGLRPTFSAGSDEAALTRSLSKLLLGSPEGGRWSLCMGGKGIERVVKFKGFKGCWGFMNAVAAQCSVEKHHPEWSNVYNTTFIRWTTHSPSGLSAKDISMALFCDEQAAAFGMLDEVPDVAKVAALANVAAMVGGDCCVPKSAKKENDKEGKGKVWSEADWGVDG